MKKLWNKNFTLLLQGGAISTIGDLMYSVAIGYWVYEQTGSSALMGVMSSISLLVTMFLSPFSGSIVDKLNRKWLMVGIDIAQGLMMILVGLLAYSNSLSVPIVLIVALLAAFGSVFYSPASSTVVLDIIPRDDMVRGQSVFSGVNSLINLVGSAVSGMLVAFFGVPLIVIINGLSNIYSAISEMLVTVPKTVRQGEPITARGILSDTVGAIKIIFSDPALKIFVPSALIINLLGSGAFALLLPFCMEKSFTVDMYGYLMAVWTAASLISVLLLGIIKLPPKMRYAVMSIGFIGGSAFMVAAFLVEDFILMCILAFISAILNTAGNAVFNAALMLALPEDNRSSILGSFNSASIGGQALSTLIYGFLGEIMPLYLLFAAGSLLSLVPMVRLCINKNVREFIIKSEGE